MRRRSWFIAIILGIGTLCGLRIADSIGDRYFRLTKERREVAISEHRARASAYRRPIVIGEPVEQNAAVWYRLVFAKTTVTMDELRDLQGEVTGDLRGYSNAHSPVAELVCGETRQPRLRDAMRCVWCDWGFGYDATDASTYDGALQATAIANCLIVEGRGLADQGKWRQASQLYEEAIGLGCDLGTGDLAMNIAGLSVARNGLIALGQLIASTDEVGFPGEVARELSAVESHLPSVAAGNELRSLQLIGDVAIERWDLVASHRNGLRSLLPWHAIAAWRLSRDLRLLTELRELQERRGAAPGLTAIKARALASNSTIIRESASGRELDARDLVEDVMRRFVVTETAIELQQWHHLHGSYPSDSDRIFGRRGGYGLKYESLDDDRGFRLLWTDKMGSPSILLSRADPQKNE